MEAVLGNLQRGLIFVVSAPAGTGKTTLADKLVKEFSCVVQSISFTTRTQREGEIPGAHYNFISKDVFKRKILAGDFLEYAEIHGEYYGTSKNWVEDKLASGKHVILVIDVQGALEIRNKIKASFIFIMPPSIEVLRKRLLIRKTENIENIERRLNAAMQEIDFGKKHYEYIIVNENLEIAYQALRSIFIAEEHRSENYLTLLKRD